MEAELSYLKDRMSEYPPAAPGTPRFAPEGSCGAFSVSERPNRTVFSRGRGLLFARTDPYQWGVG